MNVPFSRPDLSRFIQEGTDAVVSKVTFPDGTSQATAVSPPLTAFRNSSVERELTIVSGNPSVATNPGDTKGGAVTELSTPIVLPYANQNVFITCRVVGELDINSANKTQIEIKEDVWAQNQTIITISAPNDKSAAAILSKNKDKLQKLFNEAELRRSKLQLEKGVDLEESNKLLEKHGFSLKVPSEFFVSMDSSDFFFVRKNRVVGEHQILQGVMVYSYSYNNDSAFVPKVIVDSMETFIYNVKGQPKGNMAVELQYPVLKEEINFKEKYAIKLSGLWKMEGIFMGGSFINYTFLDSKEERVVNIYGFVYAPKFNHREYLRELEALFTTYHEKANINP